MLIISFRDGFIIAWGFDSPQRAKNLSTMKSFIKNLLFDKALVNQIKELKVPEGMLYNQLISGKITMQEYLQAI